MGNINYLWNITLLSKLFLLRDLWELYLFFSINYSNYKSPSILQTHGKTIHFIEMNKPKKANNKAQPRQSSPCAISQQLKLVEDSFLGPRGITSLSTHATSTHYWFFWVNLFKTQNKLISHSTTWIGLTWPARSLLQETDSWSTFPLHQLGS